MDRRTYVLCGIFVGLTPLSRSSHEVRAYMIKGNVPESQTPSTTISSGSRMSLSRPTGESHQ